MSVEIIKDLDEEVYHSQRGEETPLLTYSAVKTLVTKSPYHAYLNHPLLGAGSHKSTKAMDKGSIIHGLLLGGGQEIEELDYKDYRTKAAQEDKAAAYEAGKIPILSKDYREITEAMIIITEQIKELCPYFFEPAEKELTVKYSLDNGVKCQSRIDWIQPETGRIIDLKTCADSSPDKLEKAMLNFGYDIQESMYTKACEKAYPEMAGRFTWEFLFIETSEPYMVSIVETDSTMSWLGSHKLDRASDKWSDCLQSGIWPGYGRFQVQAPMWAVSREEEK